MAVASVFTAQAAIKIIAIYKCTYGYVTHTNLTLRFEAVLLI
jgi:hypothetical protein